MVRKRKSKSSNISKITKQVLKRDEKKCRICSSSNDIQVFPVRNDSPYSLENCVSLCPKCHNNILHLVYPKSYIIKVFGLDSLNCNSVGYDLATNTGVCIITNSDSELVQLVLFTNVFSNINNPHTLLSEITQLKDRVSQITLNTSNTDVVIEDCFYKRNFKFFKFSARAAGMMYAMHRDYHNVDFIQPSSARAKLGIKFKAKKKDTQQFLADRLFVYIDDNDQADAIVLALSNFIKSKQIMLE